LGAFGGGRGGGVPVDPTLDPLFDTLVEEAGAATFPRSAAMFVLHKSVFIAIETIMTSAPKPPPDSFRQALIFSVLPEPK